MSILVLAAKSPILDSDKLIRSLKNTAYAHGQTDSVEIHKRYEQERIVDSKPNMQQLPKGAAE